MKRRNVRRRQWRRYRLKYHQYHHYVEIDRRRSAWLQAEFDQISWEAYRQRKIARYEQDPGAWWLEDAKIAAQDFFSYCEYLEKKWGKPHGWWYKMQRKLKIERQQVEAYYASDYYQRLQAQRRASGTEQAPSDG